MALPIADRWYEREKIDDDITLLWEPHVLPLMRCNIWHLRGRDQDLFIDTGMGVASLKSAAKDLLDKPVTAVATHVHPDHVGGHHEFDCCLIHRAEAAELERPSGRMGLNLSLFDDSTITYLENSGYAMDRHGMLITALPREGYDPDSFSILPAPASILVDEGDRVDLGDRSFEILHLPGHSPGSIGLWEEETGILFSGDCVYDGPLLDGLSDSDIPAYINSMKRLRDLPVRVVHAGHDASFGRERLHQLIDAYLAKRDV